MKKILFIGLMMFTATFASAQSYSIKAQDVVTKAGVVLDDFESIKVEINYSESEKANAAQFDIDLPEGMKIEAVVLNEDRFPEYKNKLGKMYQPFAEGINDAGDRVTITQSATDQAYYFEGSSGVAIELYFSTDPEMKDGEYELKIYGGVISIPAADGGGPSGIESTSKVTIGEGTGIWSPNMWQQAKKSAIYNILGQRIYKANKAGLYIVGNKKYYKK